MENYLRPTKIIDYTDPAIQRLTYKLASGSSDSVSIAKKCFEWVRDEIKHSGDYHMNPVTCRASEVLRHKTGWCFAKSHLLAALLRANSIPTGFCYQRLSRNGKGPPFTLHGLNAVFLDGIGWYRIDARGNRSGVDVQFTPPVEHLAWPITIEGEADLPEIWPDPLSIVVDALRKYKTYDLLRQNMPDVPLIDSSEDPPRPD